MSKMKLVSRPIIRFSFPTAGVFPLLQSAVNLSCLARFLIFRFSAFIFCSPFFPLRSWRDHSAIFLLHFHFLSFLCACHYNIGLLRLFKKIKQKTLWEFLYYIIAINIGRSFWSLPQYILTNAVSLQTIRLHKMSVQSQGIR